MFSKQTNVNDLGDRVPCRRSKPERTPLRTRTHSETVRACRILFFLFVVVHLSARWLLSDAHEMFQFCCAGYLRFYGEATTSSSYGGYGAVVHNSRRPFNSFLSLQTSIKPACRCALSFPKCTSGAWRTRRMQRRCLRNISRQQTGYCFYSFCFDPYLQVEMRTTSTSSNTSTTFPKDGRPTQ